MKFFSKTIMSVFAVCIMAFSFAGCSLIELNTAKFYDQKVALYNNEISVNTRELINGYYNFGNANFDNSSTPTLQGVESTIEQLLNRKILVEALEKGDKENGVPQVKLTTAQFNAAWQSVYDYINEEVTTLENELRDDENDPFVDGSEGEEDTTTEESEEDAYKAEYTPYEPTYKYENGELVKVNETSYAYNETENTITKQEKPGEVENVSIDVYGISSDELKDKTFAQKAKLAYENFVKNYWEATDSERDVNSSSNTSYSDRALSKYIDNLKQAENGLNKSTVKEEIFLREVERLYEVYYENQLLTAYQEYYTMNDTITKEMVLSRYTSLAKAQQELYSANTTAYVSAMQNNAASMYYQSGSSDWFKVSHILISYSDTQSSMLDNLETQLSAGKISLERYNAEVQKIKDNVVATDRETGDTYSVSQLLEKLQGELYGKDSYTKLAIFKDYIYRFNMDGGVTNAEACYYIPTDSANDQMVEEFADASREIRKSGQVGTISGIVESEHGFHIIIYLGERTPLPVDGTISLLDLDNFLLNPLNNKTMLDKVIEQISISNYSAHESSLLSQIKSGKEIVYYRSVYENLFS